MQVKNISEEHPNYDFMKQLAEILNSSKYLEIIKENERRKTIEDVHIDIKELQARWKCSYSCAYEFMHSKDTNSFKAGKKLLVPLRDVIKYEKLLKTLK